MQSKIIKGLKLSLLHLFFWAGVLFFFIYFFSYNSEDTYYITRFSGMLLIVTATTTYIVLYYLIPKYYLTQQYFKLVLYSLYTLVLSVYLTILVVYISFIFITKLDVSKIPPMGKNFIFVLILVYLVVGLVSFIYLLHYNYKVQSDYKSLENKVLEANLHIKEQELYFLKKQIHPHFLFNTLNTIYGFALKKSDNTPLLIIKLSNLLDYILYQSQKPNVPLIEEIEHLNEYIDLEKIRFQDRLKVTFSHNIKDVNKLIAPMIFIPFIENSFKHGTIINGHLNVDIKLTLNNKELLFYVCNSFKETENENQNGIGLNNIKKRLELLYPSNHELNLEIKNNSFEVTLFIKLPN